MTARAAVPQEQLDLGEVEHEGEIYPTVRSLATETCAICQAPVVRAHDLTTGAEVLVESNHVVLQWVGARTDGMPLAARTSNGLVLHECQEGAS